MVCMLGQPWPSEPLVFIASGMKRRLGVLCMGLGVLPLAQTFSAVSVWSSSTTSATTPAASWGRAAPPRARQGGSGTVRSTLVRPRTAVGAAKLAVDVGDVKRSLSTAQDRLEKNRELFDEAKLAGELEYLEGVSSEAEFWNDANAARKTLGDLNRWASQRWWWSQLGNVCRAGHAQTSKKFNFENMKRPALL